MFLEKYIGIIWCVAVVRVGLLILIFGFCYTVLLSFGRQHLAVCFITFFAATLGAFLEEST